MTIEDRADKMIACFMLDDGCPVCDHSDCPKSMSEIIVAQMYEVKKEARFEAMREWEFKVTRELEQRFKAEAYKDAADFVDKWVGDGRTTNLGEAIRFHAQEVLK